MTSSSPDYRLLRGIILDNRFCMFPMLILRFWYHSFTHRKYIFESLFSKQSKSLVRICREVFASWHYWGMYPFEYFSCKLYRKEPERSLQQIIDYVPQYYLDHKVIPNNNDRLYSTILENKVIVDKLLAGKSIPRPRTLFTVEGGVISDANGNRMEEKDVASVLSGCKRSLFVKPANGRGGTGIEIFYRKDENVFCDKSGCQFSLRILEEKGMSNDYIVQDGIEQIGVLNKLFPHSTNTLRIASIVKNGHVVPVAAVLRMGRGTNCVDNSCQGGLSIEVDLDSWRLTKQAYSQFPVDVYDRHPDTQVPFGQQLPMKQEVLNLLDKAVSVINKCHIIGWDVALTPEGPILIEINPGFSINLIQIPYQRGIRKELDIYR